MGRILYGVMGDTRGHLARARTVAEEMSHHDFLFLGGGKVNDLRSEGYNVEDIPMLSTFYKDNRMDTWATVSNALKVLCAASPVRNRISNIIRNSDPDLILTDFEYFTPVAARSIGRQCVSLDHQHILTHCKYKPPKTKKLTRFIESSVIKYMRSNCSKFLIVSFFNLPTINPDNTLVFPPLVRKTVRFAKPSESDHVLVYQTSPTFHRLFPLLEKINSKFIIYGFGAKPAQKNLIFKAPSAEGFLEDLASAKYAITNGGHNVLCEAIYLGKPVLSFPISNVYEQFFNAYFLSQRGYGSYSTSLNPSKELFIDFETRLGEFKSNIRNGHFLSGNEELTSMLENLVARGESKIPHETRQGHRS